MDFLKEMNRERSNCDGREINRKPEQGLLALAPLEQTLARLQSALLSDHGLKLVTSSANSRL
jgi:hypothetical protein